MSEMSDKIEIGGTMYTRSDLSDKATVLLNLMKELTNAADEKANLIRVLTKAKYAYIEDLKREMLSAKSGFNFSE